MLGTKNFQVEKCKKDSENNAVKLKMLHITFCFLLEMLKTPETLHAVKGNFDFLSSLISNIFIVQAPLKWVKIFLRIKTKGHCRS